MWHNLKLVKLKPTVMLGCGDFGIMVAILVFLEQDVTIRG